MVDGLRAHDAVERRFARPEPEGLFLGHLTLHLVHGRLKLLHVSLLVCLFLLRV